MIKPFTFAAPLLAITLITIGTSHADHHGKKKGADLAGEWQVEAKNPNGSMSYTFSFEKKGDKLAGKSINESGSERSMDRISVDGHKIKLETDIESNGEEGTIVVTAEVNEAGDRFEGKWAVIDSSDEERMSGDIVGEKLYSLDLAGDWESVAVVGEDEMDSLTTFKKSEAKWAGGFKSDDAEAKFSKVEVEGKEVTIDFEMEVEGSEREFRITAKAASEDKLEGKWVVFNDSGEEGYSGKWVANRKAAFDLSGEWTATSEVNGEDYDSTASFKKEGDKYSGSLSSDAGTVDVSTVTVDGENVTIVFPFGETDVTIKAKVDDGALKGKWSATGDDGSEYSGAWGAKKKD